MAQSKLKVTAEQWNKITASDSKRGALPLNAERSKRYPVTVTTLANMLNAGNFKGISALRNISPDQKIYSEYECKYPTTSDKCIKIKLADGRDFRIPVFEPVNGSDTIVLEEEPEATGATRDTSETSLSAA